MQCRVRLASILFCSLSVFLANAEFAEASDDQDRQVLKEIIEAIELGWEHGDGAPFREYFLDFNGAWKVVHTHSSSRPVPTDQGEEGMTNG